MNGVFLDVIIWQKSSNPCNFTDQAAFTSLIKEVTNYTMAKMVVLGEMDSLGLIKKVLP